MSFTYNAEGIRTSKTVNGVTTTYYLNGSQILGEETNGEVILYTYDAYGSPVGFRYRGADYYDDEWDIYWYEKNLFGDIVGVYNNDDYKLITYEYDAWGNVLVTYHNGGNNTSAVNNPFLYRGYYYDSDLDLYYLNSRYYDSAIGRFISPDSVDYLGANGDLNSYNLYAYCMNNPVNHFDVNGNWSLPNWAKIAIGAAAIAVGVIATAVTGGAAAPVLVASLKIAATSAVIGAVSGAGISAVNHRVSTGSWEGAGKAAVTGAIDGACDGFMWGGITAGASFTTVAAKGIKVKEIGKLKPSNKPGDGYSGVKYQAPKANGKYTTRSIELHSPHKSGPHNVWHWQQNTWNPYNNSITGSAKHWTIWGKPL